MYEDLARGVLIEEDPKVQRAVERIRSRHPRLSDRDVARRIVESAAWRCAAVGAASSAAAELLDRLVATADFSYQSVSLNRLAASVALARRRQTGMLERGVTAAASVIFAGASLAVRRGSSRVARRALGRRAPGLVPILSALAGGAASYAAARIFVRASEEFFAELSRRR